MKKGIRIGIVIIILLGVGICGFFRGRNTKVVDNPEQETAIELIPFQSIFERCAPEIGWDWELLAALCYEESHFNPKAGNSSGARGLMQLMPKTAHKFGLNDSTILVPDSAIKAGVKYISFLQKRYSFINNPTEQHKFVIASYNAGPAHILDARRLAEKNGYNPYVWTDNTEFWIEQLQYDSIAADSIVKYGVFHDPYQTINHVKKVFQRYKKYKKITEQAAKEQALKEENQTEK